MQALLVTDFLLSAVQAGKEKQKAAASETIAMKQ
jgi:hypothetical protein